MATTAAEAVGLIKGLAEIVKLQQMTQATQQFEAKKKLQQLSNTMHDLSQVIKTTQTKPTPHQALRLPDLILPEFTGREDLDRFLDQVSTFLEATGVPPQHWLTSVKQQCNRDIRAYDALLDAETKHSLACLGPDPSKASPDDSIKYYKAYLSTLKEKRGKSQDQKIRELLSASHTMQQGKNESVSDSTHRSSGFQKFSINWRSTSPMYINPKMVQRLN